MFCICVLYLQGNLGLFWFHIQTGSTKLHTKGTQHKESTLARSQKSYIHPIPTLVLHFHSLLFGLLYYFPGPMRSESVEPTRLLCPWNSPGKNTQANCHSLLQGISWSRNRTLASCITGRCLILWAIYPLFLKKIFDSVVSSLVFS